MQFMQPARFGLLATVLGACLTLCARNARAQAPRAVVASAPARAGQPALSVGFDANARLRAAVCRKAPCALDHGIDLQEPRRAQAHAAHGRLTVVPIGAGRHAIVVRIPDPARGLDWQAVVAAPLGGGAPDVVFSGWTGLSESPDGVRRGKMVMISAPAPDGTRRVAIGQESEDLDLCGRPAILAPQVLAAQDLRLHPAEVQRLSAAERERAHDVVAERLDDQAPGATRGLLRAVGASSAVGQPAALTDGDPETTWAENRGGDGRGEFVVMNAPPELPLTGFVVTVRPPQGAPEHGVAPQQFWIATDHRLYRVTMPEDAWQHPGARYLVSLQRPLRTDCVALVVESAYGKSEAERVTFAEFGARTAFDSRHVSPLIAALRRGGDGARAAGAVLGTLGEPAYAAIGKAFATLDENARRIALDVLDGAPCPSSVPVYLRALTGPYPAQRRHAREHIESCGAQGAKALSVAVARAPARVVPAYAAELALVDPALAVRAIAPRLDNPDPEQRRRLRVALAEAAGSGKADGAIRAVLGDPRLGEMAAIDVLRALGPRLARFEPEAGRAFARLALPGASFRTRYLLLGPAAALAERDPPAQAFLESALTADRDPHIRARAAEVVSAAQGSLRAGLLHALDDPAMRARKAAVETLGRLRASFASRAIARRLHSDPWPLVRSAAADALSELAASPAVDAALGDALGDAAPSVRARVLRALGARRATRYADQVRARLDDHDEVPNVRAEAARALGMLCDARSIATLTGYARRLSDPAAPPDVQAIGPGALEALGRLHPSDLAHRLAPLLGPRVSPAVRAAARAALASPPACRSR